MDGNGPLEDHFVNITAAEEIKGSLRITFCQNVPVARWCSSLTLFSVGQVGLLLLGLCLSLFYFAEVHEDLT